MIREGAAMMLIDNDAPTEGSLERSRLHGSFRDRNDPHREAHWRVSS